MPGLLMFNKKLERLSRFLSYLLRHDPSALGLHLDENGFIPIRTLLGKLHRTTRWSWVTKDDLVVMIRASGKARFEISNERVRATYGHSILAKIAYPEVPPPSLLYHGTPRKSAAAIEREGLKPAQRQYVHLSSTISEALDVGARRDSTPAIFAVKAREACAEGIRFYKSGTVFLADMIPARFLERIKQGQTDHE